MGGRFGAEGHRPILIPTPEISKDPPMIATVINIAVSFVGVVVFGAALLLALTGFVVVCIARKGDRPVTLSPRWAGAYALFIGAGIASGVFALLVGPALR